MPGMRVASCLLLLLASSAVGDVLELRDGRVLEGRLATSSGQLIRFETDAGIVAVPVEEAASIRFGEPAASGAEAAPAPGDQPAPPSASERTPRATVQAPPLEIPAGTRLRIRVKDTLDPRRATAGDRFAGWVEVPLTADGRVVVPARAVVYGVVSAASPTGPAAQQLRLELTDLQLAGRRLAIVTGPHARVAETPVSGAPANAADATGSVTPRVPAGAVLEFRLLQPLEL